MSNDLLPPNATAQERAISEAVARVSDVPILVRETWNPNTCPAHILPWLAWAMSVDEWDTSWTEQQKRDVINSSLYVHKHKGTIGAIERALTPLGLVIEVKEWFNMEPPGDPFTFSIVISKDDEPVSGDFYERAERLVQKYKNLRSHLIGLTVSSEVSGTLYFGSVTVDGTETTIFPEELP
jgi:phage tail P2-like protein